MSNLKAYFDKVTYKSKYFIGDRVDGTWNKIPFRGTVGNDTLVSPEEGAKVSIHLDLPIKYKDKLYTIIWVKHKQIKKVA